MIYLPIYGNIRFAFDNIVVDVVSVTDVVVVVGYEIPLLVWPFRIIVPWNDVVHVDFVVVAVGEDDVHVLRMMNLPCDDISIVLSKNVVPHVQMDPLFFCFVFVFTFFFDFLIYIILSIRLYCIIN
jgi:hypothetical protein